MTVPNPSSTDPTSIRERNQTALRGIFSDHAPSAEEARFDKIEIELTADVHGSRDIVNEYVSHLNDRSGAFAFGDINETLFQQFGNQRGRRAARVRENRWTLTGDAALHHNSRGARIVLRLKLNPTRTAQHALAAVGYDGINDLNALEFFRRSSRVRAETEEATLTRTDNALLGTARLGGLEASARFSRNRDFLNTYETKFVELMHETFMPSELGFPAGERSGQGRLYSGIIGVSFNWAGLTVRQAEVYWERHHPNALAIARRLSERLVNSAPRATLRRFQGPLPGQADRVGDSVSVTIPQREDLDLVMYAKTTDRVRFEMRYQKKLRRILRERVITSSEHPLVPWLVGLAEHAQGALRWREITGLIPSASSVDALELFPIFVDRVRRACEQADRMDDYAHILRYLVESGGMSERGEIDPDGQLIEELSRARILIWVRSRTRSRGAPRRWVVDARFEPLLSCLSGGM